MVWYISGFSHIGMLDVTWPEWLSTCVFTVIHILWVKTLQRPLQGCHLRNSPVVVWHFAIVKWPSCRRCSWAAAAFHSEPIMRRDSWVVTRTYSNFGDRAFLAAGSGLWNSLPSHLKNADLSYNEFRWSSKTFLFGQWGHGPRQCELY